MTGMEKDKAELASEIRDRMLSTGRTVSTAESCTGGRIASALTSVSGSSGYFQGGIVAYQNYVKTRFLSVPETMIEQCNVVSREVAEQMVRGACELFGTDYALASTGCTGEGTDGTPSGSIWIAFGNGSDVHSIHIGTDYGRERNTENAVMTILSEFLKYLES